MRLCTRRKNCYISHDICGVFLMLTLSVLKEETATEKRVAVSPDSVKKYVVLGCAVRVESAAGMGSGISDAEFQNAGATIAATASECLAGTNMLLTVTPPQTAVINQLSPQSVVVGVLSAYQNRAMLEQLAARGVSAFAMELMPRISRAQSMDVLSSQANLAGYRAVIEGVAALGKATPMMMTAAGTVPPAKVLVVGAGVAGLQAIATAKRLGAVVMAFDVRPVVKEQVESLGAKFVEVKAEEGASAETAGGYAKEMSEEYKAKQAVLLHETVKKMDIVITTALIPGRPAPVLITEAMVNDMKPGSVIVDLAVASGGNCPLSKPDVVVEVKGVKVLGFTNLPSRVAADATPLYARNLYTFIATLINKEKQLTINLEDELVKGTMLTHGGAIVHPQFKGAAA
jgi:H+-translocating NAD(P) transhydrogenase subunit alpha